MLLCCPSDIQFAGNASKPFMTLQDLYKPLKWGFWFPLDLIGN